MKLFFAGSENKVHARFLKDAAARNILESCFYLNYERQPNHLEFPVYVLDSGGFTARKQGAPVSVEKYSNFLNRYNVKIAFNLDTLDVEETLKNQEYLEKHTATYIIPVYHYSEFRLKAYRNLIDKYIEKYPYIALGGTAEGATGLTENKLRFFDYCFSKTRDKTRVHGLAVTSWRLLLRYPWYSVDSTTWLSYERFGMRFLFSQGQLTQVHSLRLVKEGKAKIKNILQMNENEHQVKVGNIQAFIDLEKYVTELWKKRGVIWDDFYKKYGMG